MRKLSPEKVGELATGAVFPERTARRVGLVDWVGDIHDAHRQAAKLAGRTAESTRLVIYRRPNEYHRSLYDAPSSAQAESGIGAAVLELLSPSGARFQYLWSPG